MELAKEIFWKYKGGMHSRYTVCSDLTATYRILWTTISTIVKNKDMVKYANIAKGIKSISKPISETLEHVMNLLLLWVTEKQCTGGSASEAIICE